MILYHMSFIVIIITIFLIFNLVIGLMGHRIDNFKQYTVGNKNFSSYTLVGTLLATYFSGFHIWIIPIKICENSVLNIFILFFSVLSMFMISQFIAPRMGEFMCHLSIAESIGSLYGRIFRRIAAVTAIFCVISRVIVQFYILFTSLSSYLNNVQNSLIVLSAVMILLIYSIFSGIRGITFTDILQFITLVLFLLIFIWLLLKQHGGFKDIKIMFNNYINSTLEKSNISNCLLNLSSIYWIAVSAVFLFAPELIQRVYMSSDVWQAKRVFGCAGSVACAINLLIVFFSILLLVNNDYLTLEFLLKLGELSNLFSITWHSLVCLATLSLTMSTIDSCLHIVAVLIVHDLTTLFTKNNVMKLFVVKISVLIVGILSAIIALYFSSDIMIIIILSFSAYLPVVVVPFIMAVLGFRLSTSSVLWGIGMYLLSFIGGCYFFLSTKNVTSTVTLISMSSAISIFVYLFFLIGSYCFKISIRK